MSTVGTQAAEAILRLVKQNEQLTFAANILSQYGSFEAALGEVKTAHSNELAALTKLKEDAAAYREKADQERAKIRAQVESEELTLKSIRVQAETEADAILDAAQAKASQVVDNARDEANSLTLKSKTTLQELETKISETLQRLAEAQAKFEEESVKVTKTEAAYAKIKASISKFSGDNA